MFVTFEGPEGGGKSTALAAVAAMLRERGVPVVVTREPGGGQVGQGIRELLLHGDSLSAATELLLFLADRANNVEKIVRPALAQGAIVLCDRHADSTLAYQGLARGLDEGFVRSGNAFATGGLKPDLTLLFDLPAEVGLARLKNKDRLDSEPVEFHRRVREGFLSLAREEPKRWRIIDATRSANEVSQNACQAVIESLSKQD